MEGLVCSHVDIKKNVFKGSNINEIMNLIKHQVIENDQLPYKTYVYTFSESYFDVFCYDSNLSILLSIKEKNKNTYVNNDVIGEINKIMTYYNDNFMNEINMYFNTVSKEAYKELLNFIKQNNDMITYDVKRVSMNRIIEEVISNYENKVNYEMFDIEEIKKIVHACYMASIHALDDDDYRNYRLDECRNVLSLHYLKKEYNLIKDKDIYIYTIHLTINLFSKKNKTKNSLLRIKRSKTIFSEIGKIVKKYNDMKSLHVTNKKNEIKEITQDEIDMIFNELRGIASFNDYLREYAKNIDFMFFEYGIETSFINLMLLSSNEKFIHFIDQIMSIDKYYPKLIEIAHNVDDFLTVNNDCSGFKSSFLKNVKTHINDLMYESNIKKNVYIRENLKKKEAYINKLLESV